MKALKISPKMKPSREEAEEAVKTLIKWLGEDPDRSGLLKTPARVIDSYAELFCGYNEDPIELLETSFENSDNYQDMIMLENISFQSYCEHHMLPIVGKANVAYIPNKRIVGIGRIARVVDIFARRLQIQENMTVQIAEAINKTLDARGVAVSIEAMHHCMSSRGVNKIDSHLVTYHLLGELKENTVYREKFFKKIST